MDSVYDRVNYCLSAAGDEYLYYMLRTPRQVDDFDDFEKKTQFFQSNSDKRLEMQLIFSDIGKSSKYSIYDYIDYLQKAVDTGNGRHFVGLALIVLAIVLCFYNFTTGFFVFIAVMLFQIFSYFRIKGDIDPYLVTYGYIMRVIKSIDSFKGIDDEVFAEDVRELTEKSFRIFALSAPKDFSVPISDVRSIIKMSKPEIIVKPAIPIISAKITQMFTFSTSSHAKTAGFSCSTFTAQYSCPYSSVLSYT